MTRPAMPSEKESTNRPLAASIAKGAARSNARLPDGQGARQSGSEWRLRRFGGQHPSARSEQVPEESGAESAVSMESTGTSTGGEESGAVAVSIVGAVSREGAESADASE
jgi:hypothetical protein